MINVKDLPDFHHTVALELHPTMRLHLCEDRFTLSQIKIHFVLEKFNANSLLSQYTPVYLKTVQITTEFLLLLWPFSLCLYVQDAIWTQKQQEFETFHYVHFAQLNNSNIVQIKNKFAAYQNS